MLATDPDSKYAKKKKKDEDPDEKKVKDTKKKEQYEPALQEYFHISAHQKLYQYQKLLQDDAS